MQAQQNENLKMQRHTGKAGKFKYIHIQTEDGKYRHRLKYGKYMHRRMKTVNTETYSHIWEIQANTDTYRLKIWKQIFVDLRIINIDTQKDKWAIHAQQNEDGEIQRHTAKTGKYR